MPQRRDAGAGCLGDNGAEAVACWPLDLRHLQRDSGFSAGFGAEGEPAYTLTSALTGGGNIPAVAVEYEGEDDEGMASGHAPPTEERE